MSSRAVDLGPVHTRGTSFRARAEARQRQYRANVLGAGHGKVGHFLDAGAALAGKNFVTVGAHAMARAREARGKGVGDRTFSNMLSSQAMCFNVFAPLAEDVALATRILGPLVSGLASVRSIEFEHTPPAEIFRDQSGRGGVDCDLLVEADWADGERCFLVVETKFVEPEFSGCGFRAAGRARRGLPVCPGDIPVRADAASCLYTSRKGYGYWARSNELVTLDRRRLPEAGCPFDGVLWQLWVNHTLSHALALHNGVRHARFGVCAPWGNDALLRDGAVLGAFRALLAEPTTLVTIFLDDLLERIADEARVDSHLRLWSDGLAARYFRI